jgi:hypothetical protein
MIDFKTQLIGLLKLLKQFLPFQYKIEMEEPLFDILTDDVVNGGNKSNRDSKDDPVIGYLKTQLKC